MTFPRTRLLLEEAIRERATPAVVCEVGRAAGPLWRAALGTLSYAPGAPACVESTVFDLASLTKVIATTSLAMRHVQSGTLDVSTPVGECVPEWRVAGADDVTIGHLLDHSSGLPAHVRLWESIEEPDVFRRALLEVGLERPVGAQSVYSDVGFMLLGFALEARGHADLSAQWQALWPEGAPLLGYRPARESWPGIAPTEADAWRGRILQGEVHDENAAMLDGVAGHAGLFGSAEAVGHFAATVLQSFHAETWLTTPEMMRTFATPRNVPGSSRALGWDTMLPTSSCGTRLSPSSIGHTGFTGTSLWIDWERDLYIVLLSNRVHPTRTNERFPPMRARIHNALVLDLESA
ncbi:MAG: beta-lactamase family protein [Acidobacteria bacterium]|nr:beta-lactamase family protein [Acidobacteriota bacterium]